MGTGRDGEGEGGEGGGGEQEFLGVDRTSFLSTSISLHPCEVCDDLLGWFWRLGFLGVGVVKVDAHPHEVCLGWVRGH